MKKKLSCMLLAMLFTLSLSACGESEEKRQIEELKALIEAQSQTIAELGGTLSSLHSALETQGESLEELQATVSAQAEEIKTLQFHNDILAGLYMGKFFTLQEAFNNKYITFNDLQTISKTCGQNISSVAGNIVNMVKATYYRQLCKETRPNGEKLFPNADINDIQNILFYGEYNGSYCFRICHPYADYGTALIEETIEGVLFVYSGPSYVIWKKII